MTRACKDCEFYEPLLSGVGVYSETNGRCHRPVPDAGAGWPYVLVDDWCGEFQLRGLEPDPVDAVKKLSRCFAELSLAQESRDLERFVEIIDERISEILADVNQIIDLPAAVDELKKEQER